MTHAVDPQAVINAQQQQLADAMLQNAIKDARIADLEARLAQAQGAEDGPGEG